MRRLLIGSLILLAAVALLATGCEKIARVPAGNAGDSSCGGRVHGAPRGLAADSAGMSDMPAVSHRGTVRGLAGEMAEVVVTAERPAWVMSEVVVRANMMTEVVVYASWPTAVAAAGRSVSLLN